MTVSTINRKNSYTSNGVLTTYPFTFTVSSANDVYVTKTISGEETLLTKDTDYTVTVNDSKIGGNIIFQAGYIPVNNALITIYRDVALTQETDYVENSPFHAETHEDALDKLTMQTQQLNEEVTRSIKAPISDSNSVAELPAEGVRATHMLGFDSNGSPTVSESTLDDMDAAVSAARDAGTLMSTDTFTGDGSTVAYNISPTAPNKNGLLITIDGVTQEPASYSLSNKTITFSEAPPNNSLINIRNFGYSKGAFTGDSSQLTYNLNKANTVTRTTKSRLQTRYLLSDWNGNINNAFTDVSSNATLVIDVDATLSADILLANTMYLEFTNNSKITISSGYTLTIYSPSNITAPNNQQIFAGDGTVAYSTSAGERSVMHFGAKGDGTTNDTPAIQACLNAVTGGDVIIPKTSVGTYLIDEQATNYCLLLTSNLNLKIEPGVTIQADSGIGVSVRMFYLYNIDNVKISGYGATLDGNGPYASGADRHAIRLQTATNVLVEGLTLQNTGGDGYYIGGLSENVKFIDVISTGNRRGAATIVGGKNIHLLRGELNSTDGEAPEHGLDIEPNGNDVLLENIVIEKVRANNNDGFGFTVNVNAFDGAVDKNLDITFIDCVDDGSLGFGVTQGDITTEGNVMNGHISFIRSISMNSRAGGFNIRNYDSNLPRIIIDHPKVIDCNTDNATTAKTHAPFSVFRESTDGGAPTIGNVQIIEPIIEYSGTPPNCQDFYFRALTGSEGLTKVELINPIKVGQTNEQLMATINGRYDLIVEDKRELFRHSGTETLQNYYYGSIYDNSGAAATFTLTAQNVGYPDITFEVVHASYLTIDPDGTSTINPGGTGAGKYIRSNTVGSRVTLRRDSLTTWKIMNIVGTWEYE